MFLGFLRFCGELVKNKLRINREIFNKYIIGINYFILLRMLTVRLTPVISPGIFRKPKFSSVKSVHK